MRKGTCYTVSEKTGFVVILLVVGVVLLSVMKGTEAERRHVFIPAPVLTTLDRVQEPEENLVPESSPAESKEEEVLSAEEQKARSVGMTFEQSIPISVNMQKK